MPEVVNGYGADRRWPGCRCATASTTRTRRRQKETQYYEMLGHARASGTRAGRPSPSTVPFDRHGQLRRGPLAAVPHRRGPLRGPRPRRPAPGQGQGARRPLDARRRRKYNVLPLNDLTVARDSSRWSSPIPVPPSGQYTYYPGTIEVPERSAANVHGVSFKVLAEVEFTERHRGRHLRPGLALRRALAVRQGRHAHVRLQLPRHPAGDPHHDAGPAHGTAHRRRRVHQGADGRAPRVARPAEAVHRRQRQSPSRRSGRRPATSRCAAKGCASATTAATR